VVPKKLCSQCGEEKPANIKYFIKSRAYEDNLKPLCRVCTKEKEQAQSRESSKRRREDGRYKKHIENNPRLYYYNVAKNHAKAKGQAFTITLGDMPDIPTHCPVFGYPMELDVGSRSMRAPSLDRMDTTKGYEPGNIEFISWRANYLKRNGTLEEFEQLVAHMRKMLVK
jgi:hypothetical protein